MKQPELGIYIAQLRKEKGLTQEELVERCNINVRTIQRIEAGEVSPRSYTIKNILEVLGKSFDEVYSGTKEGQDSKEVESSAMKYSFNNSLLLFSGIGGVILFICYYLMTINDVFHSFTQDNILPESSYTILGVVSIVTVVLFYTGIYYIAQIKNNSLLKFSSILAMIINVISSILLITVIDYDSNLISPRDILFGIFVIVASGITYLMLGAAYLSQRKNEEGLAKYLGFVGLIAGGFMITVLLAPIAIVLMLIFDLGQIILLFRNLSQSKKSINS
ncbi:MAG: helix-turn-helix domain-containing protein [Bacteroidota bacterium]|nr:helix-turn-helix domain-containing protein [Bacteroidota bacterium]